MGYANEIECVSGWTALIDITQSVKWSSTSKQSQVVNVKTNALQNVIANKTTLILNLNM